MRNILNNKSWCIGVLQINVDPPPITLIKSKSDIKAKNDCVKMKLRRDLTSETLDLYEFKMSLFDNGKLGVGSYYWCETSKLRPRLWEQFLPAQSYSIFVCYYDLNCYFSLILYVIMWGVRIHTFKRHHFGFRYILFPVYALSKQTRVMRHGMINPRGLKVR